MDLLTLNMRSLSNLTEQFHTTLSHYGPARKARSIKVESHNLHYHLNNLNAEQNPSNQLNSYNMYNHGCCLKQLASYLLNTL